MLKFGRKPYEAGSGNLLSGSGGEDRVRPLPIFCGRNGTLILRSELSHEDKFEQT